MSSSTLRPPSSSINLVSRASTSMSSAPGVLAWESLAIRTASAHYRVFEVRSPTTSDRIVSAVRIVNASSFRGSHAHASLNGTFAPAERGTAECVPAHPRAVPSRAKFGDATADSSSPARRVTPPRNPPPGRVSYRARRLRVAVGAAVEPGVRQNGERSGSPGDHHRRRVPAFPASAIANGGVEFKIEFPIAGQRKRATKLESHDRRRSRAEFVRRERILGSSRTRVLESPRLESPRREIVAKSSRD